MGHSDLAKAHCGAHAEACPPCETHTPLRNNYFFGKLMEVIDFDVEQLYVVEKWKRHHARLHGTGVVCGLEVKAHGTPGCRDRYLVVQPGTALDCCGNEILVIDPETIDITAFSVLNETDINATIEMALETGCNGLIATNTTITREGLVTPARRIEAIGAGGLSGAPLRKKATAVLARVARRVLAQAPARRVPVIGVGGVDSAEAAWEKLAHGATLVQVYSALVYHGPGLVAEINRGLIAQYERHGLRNIGEAIGRAL